MKDGREDITAATNIYWTFSLGQALFIHYLLSLQMDIIFIIITDEDTETLVKMTIR